MTIQKTDGERKKEKLSLLVSGDDEKKEKRVNFLIKLNVFLAFDVNLALSHAPFGFLLVQL